jgi:antitoxin component YwqK of YwqJK toxin-antitoxin module
LSFEEFSYYDNGQFEFIKTYNSEELLHGISTTYHQNGQLKSKEEYKNGNLVEIIEQYDFNGNSLN